MARHTDAHQTNDALDGLVSELLGCGAVPSQIVRQMIQVEAAGRSAPDAAPIPAAAHSVILSVLVDLRHRHSPRDLTNAAAIVKEATDAMVDDIFFLPLEEADGSGVDDHAGDAGE